eukprot:m.137766 g.137766  ORF g.137766 m.137766 type:complete len:88 (+) comp17005_c0_seq4:593-856(+)
MAGIPGERILPKSLSLQSPELKDVRQEWQRIFLRHLAAQFAGSFQQANKPKRRMSKSRKQRAKRMASDEVRACVAWGGVSFFVEGRL